MKLDNNLPKSIPLHSQSKKIDDKKFIPTPYKKIAESMEQQFAEHMLEEMKKSLDSGENSTASTYYKNLLNKEQAKGLVHNSQLGIQDMILNDIYPKRLRNEITYNHQVKKLVPQKNSISMGPKQPIKMATQREIHDE